MAEIRGQKADSGEGILGEGGSKLPPHW